MRLAAKMVGGVVREANPLALDATPRRGRGRGDHHAYQSVLAPLRSGPMPGPYPRLVPGPLHPAAPSPARAGRRRTHQERRGWPRRSRSGRSPARCPGEPAHRAGRALRIHKRKVLSSDRSPGCRAGSRRSGHVLHTGGASHGLSCKGRHTARGGRLPGRCLLPLTAVSRTGRRAPAQRSGPGTLANSLSP